MNDHLVVDGMARRHHNRWPVDVVCGLFPPWPLSVQWSLSHCALATTIFSCALLALGPFFKRNWRCWAGIMSRYYVVVLKWPRNPWDLSLHVFSGGDGWTDKAVQWSLGRLIDDSAGRLKGNSSAQDFRLLFCRWTCKRSIRIKCRIKIEWQRGSFIHSQLPEKQSRRFNWKTIFVAYSVLNCNTNCVTLLYHWMPP